MLFQVCLTFSHWMSEWVCSNWMSWLVSSSVTLGSKYACVRAACEFRWIHDWNSSVPVPYSTLLTVPYIYTYIYIYIYISNNICICYGMRTLRTYFLCQLIPFSDTSVYPYSLFLCTRIPAINIIRESLKVVSASEQTTYIPRTYGMSLATSSAPENEISYNRITYKLGASSHAVLRFKDSSRVS